VFSSEVEAGSREENASNKRAEDARPDKAQALEKFYWQEEWDRQTRKKPAVPCRCIEIAGRKCGFAGQPERQGDPSDPPRHGNAISALT
jgi:hypothetical protein